MKRIWKSMQRFWDGGLLSLRPNANRKDSLFVIGAIVGTYYFIGFFEIIFWYQAIALGFFGLALDEHNIKETS